MKTLKKAFTLVELMVVITVIAILMTIAIVSFTRIQKQARDTKRKADIRTLETALQAYFTENQTYPINTTTGGELATTALAVLAPTYIPVIPVAPPGTAGSTNPGYMYISGPNGFTYSICNDLETATASAGLGMWVASTSNAGGYVTDDAACVAPTE